MNIDTMPRTPHRTDPATLLATIPHRLGYHPQDSLVVIPVAEGRSAGLCRIDLHPADGAEGGRDGGGSTSPVTAADIAIGVLCQVQRVDAFLAITYLAGATHETVAEVGEPVIAELRRAAAHCGFHLAEALWVASDGWGTFASGTRPGSGTHGAPRPLSLIREAEAVLHVDCAEPGHPAPDQFAGATITPADTETRERMRRALDELDRADQFWRRGGDVTSLGMPAVAALLLTSTQERLPELFEECLTERPEDSDPMMLAMISWSLARPLLRDVALSQWSADLGEGYAALRFNLDYAQGARTEAPGPVRLMGEGPRPDPDRLERAISLCRHLVAATDDHRHTIGPLVALAWLSWAIGRASHASVYAARVRDIEPDHGLAEIVTGMLSVGYQPPWAFRSDQVSSTSHG